MTPIRCGIVAGLTWVPAVLTANSPISCLIEDDVAVVLFDVREGGALTTLIDDQMVELIANYEDLACSFVVGIDDTDALLQLLEFDGYGVVTASDVAVGNELNLRWAINHIIAQDRFIDSLM